MQSATSPCYKGVAIVTGLFRRGGIWWTRMVVPTRLREAAGRREFVQSTRTHECAIAKLVSAMLQANWRGQLMRLESRPMSADILNLIESAPALSGRGFLPLGEAVRLSGIPQNDLLRACASGGIRLYCRISNVRGHLVSESNLELINPVEGRSGGLVIPSPEQMPLTAEETTMTGVLRIIDSKYVADVVLTDGLVAVELVALDAPDRAGWLFAPDLVVRRHVVALEVMTAEVEAIRKVMAAKVSPEHLEHALALRKAKVEGKATSAGKWADKKISAAIEEYCKRSDGLAATLASEHEIRQRKKGLLVFPEFMGDLPLSEIDGDVLRAFRNGPLKELPSHANHLKKKDRHDTMRETVAALKAAGTGYEMMTSAQQQERMRWLFRLFAWMVHKGYLDADPAISLRGETGMTKAEKITAAREADSHDDDEGRRAFTDDELKLIFGVQHYQSGNGAHVTKGNQTWYPFQYWLPLLGLYAGCRIKEAAQLHLSDVCEINGVWYLDINRRTGDKALKTEASVRQIPLHGKLIELGFVKYCERLRLKMFQRVFPELTYALTPARYAKEPIRKMSAMLKSLGMPRDNSLVFHNFRRNSNNKLGRVPATVLMHSDEKLRVFMRYRVIGHELPDDVNAKHYTETTMTEIAMLVNGVVYDLPKIAPFDIEHGLQRITLSLENKEGWRKGKEDMGPLNPAKPIS